MATLMIWVLLTIVSIPTNSGDDKKDAVCPCHFDFSSRADDPFCYGAVPLVAGIKDISYAGDRQDATFEDIINETCAHVGGYVLFVDNTTDTKALFKEYESLRELYAMFFVGSTSTDFDCGYFDESGDTVVGDCLELLEDEPTIADALCMKAPLFESTDDPCVCPCTFFYDSNYKCVRDMEGCQFLLYEEDMLDICTSAMAAPATVVRVKDKDSVPLWPWDAAFFVGLKKANHSRTCGVYSSAEDGKLQVKDCDTLLEQYEIPAVMCYTYETESKDADDCPEDSEDDIDAPYCAASKHVKNGLMVACSMAVNVLVVKKFFY